MAFLVTRGSMAGTSTATTDLDELLVGATTTPGCSTDAAATSWMETPIRTRNEDVR